MNERFYNYRFCLPHGDLPYYFCPYEPFSYHIFPMQQLPFLAYIMWFISLFYPTYYPPIYLPNKISLLKTEMCHIIILKSLFPTVHPPSSSLKIKFKFFALFYKVFYSLSLAKVSRLKSSHASLQVIIMLRSSVLVTPPKDVSLDFAFRSVLFLSL